MTPEPSREIWHRGDFALLCEWHRLTRIVEVGVDRGDFAQVFLSRIINCELYLGVDSYEEYGEMKWGREGDFQMACMAVSPWRNKAKIVRARSVDVATSIPTLEATFYRDPYDFVYVDASHRKEDVLADLEAWFPIVSDKGILAGHDWVQGNGDFDSVRSAVTDFASTRELQVYYTSDDPSSWYMYKSGIPGADWKRC